MKAQVDAGKLQYASNCANCHGSAGKGANGPALADRNLSETAISDTILHGGVGTPMPPFKDELDPKSQVDVIAYVLWLTSGGSLPQSIVFGSTRGSNASPSRRSHLESVAIGKGVGRPAVRASLFFDPTKLYSCRTCHSYSHVGRAVGADLANGGKSPVDIYRNLVHADVKASGFPAIAVGLRAGGRLRGIKSRETADAIMVFDLSSLPPVERTILRTEISTVSEVRNTGIYDHTKLPFTNQDLLDLSAFLGKSSLSPESQL